jgi:hypothetical protein
MKALMLIPDSPSYCRASWVYGLHAWGFDVVFELHDVGVIGANDCVVMWNRNPSEEAIAKRFEDAGALVLVAENGYLGKEWGGHKWFALSVGHHNGAGVTLSTRIGSKRRKQYGFKPAPWRNGGTEIIGLPQRGIGEAGIAMPMDWVIPEQCTRIRPHVGTDEQLPIEKDLHDAKAVCTWGSGGAIKALAMGIPVFYEFRNWIAAEGATHISQADWETPQRPDREKAFDAVFGGMFTLGEVESGEAFRLYL